MTRRKVTDPFDARPLAVDLAPFVERDEDSDPNRDPNPDQRTPPRCDLAFILVHRGQNATSGHYVALVRENFESNEPGGARGGDSTTMSGTSRGRALRRTERTPQRARGRRSRAEKNRPKDPERREPRVDKDGARASTPKPSFGTRAAPKKGRDGSSLGEDAFRVFRRVHADVPPTGRRRRRPRRGALDETSAPGGSRGGGSRGRRCARGDDGDVRGARSGRTRADRARRASAREAAEAVRAGTLSSGARLFRRRRTA